MTCISFGERAFHGWTRHPILCPLSSSLWSSLVPSALPGGGRWGRLMIVVDPILVVLPQWPQEYDCVSVCKSKRRMRKNCCFCLLVCGPGIAKPSFRVNSNVSSSGLMVLVTCTCASTVCVCVLHHISRTTPNEPTSPVAVKKRAVFHPGTNRENHTHTHTGTKRIQKAKWSTMRIVENKRSEIKCENDTTMVSGQSSSSNKKREGKLRPCNTGRTN